jgi:hypothetical protein
MPKLTVKDLLELKGVRQIAFVQVGQGEEALAAAAAGMDMIGNTRRTCEPEIGSVEYCNLDL